jgi:multidrug resistance efflux pump
LNANDAAATAKHTDLTAAKILFAQTAKGQGVLTNDKALVERLDNFFLTDQTPFRCDAERAARLIEAQAAEIERLEKAIKLQASAVRTLQANEDTEINILRQQKREWHGAVSSLDSERAANAILTTEIERLKRALWKIEFDVQQVFAPDEPLTGQAGSEA